MLRVGFDDQIFRAQRRGGVSRYFVELVKRLPSHDIDPVLYVAPTTNLHLAESGLVASTRNRTPIERLTWATWRAAGRPRVRVPRDAPIDLLHHTYSHPAYLRDWVGPRVSTIHDMTPELFPQQFRLGNPHFAKREYYRLSDVVICVSENTRDDLERFYGARDPRARVVHLGVGEDYFSDVPAPPGLPERFVLFVGVRGGYKDFRTALGAFTELAHEDSELEFVLVGGGPLTRAEHDVATTHGIRPRIRHLAPGDQELIGIYQRAQALIFPSRYEGFGLPTVEALASGTPAVLADASCMREIGNGLAHFFTAGDPHAAAGALRTAMQTADSPAARSERRAYARRFTWDAVAAATASAYHAAVG